MIELEAFTVAGSARWNDNGFLDIENLAITGFQVPELPHTGRIQVVVALRSAPSAVSTVSLRLAVAGPDQKMFHAQEHLDPWPSSPDEWQFSRLQLTYSVEFTASEPGTHAMVLFLNGEDRSRAVAPFYVGVQSPE